MSSEHLEELMSQYHWGRLSRRQFLRSCLLLGLSAPAASALLSACGPTTAPAADTPAPAAAPTSAPAAAAPRRGGSLVYGIHNELQPIDYNTPWFPEIGYSDIYEYLTSIDPHSGQLVPWLAESFEMAPDGLTITFKLRTDKKFHNGDPFNAQMVKELIDYWHTPESAFPEAYFLNVESVEAPDDATVIFHMKGVDTQALWGTSYSFAPMINVKAKKANLEAYGKSMAIGTGPYKFQSWEGDTAISVRNEEYAGAPPFMDNQGPGYLDQIKYVWLPDQATRSINLEAGDFDIVEQPAPQDVARLEANPDIVVLKRPAISVLYLGFNFQNPIVQDHAVREAIYRSIDRQAIIDQVMFGQAVAAYSPVPPHDVAYWQEAETLYPFDVEKAKSLLEEAGWKAGPDGTREKDGQKLALGLMVLSTSEQKITGEVIQQQVAKAGITINLEVLDKGTHQSRLMEGKNDLHFFRYVYDSAVAVLKILYDSNFIVPNGANWSFYVNKEADKWFESFNTTPDEAKRVEAIVNVQKELLKDIANVPIYSPRDVWAMRKWVQGWKVNPYTIYNHHNDLWVSEDSPRASG